MNVQPTQLERLPDHRIQITWSDGVRGAYSPKQLRDACPCATCREKRLAPLPAMSVLLPVLSAAEARPLTIAGMQPVGNYAYSIRFSDDHDSGIFTFDFLRELGTETDGTAQK